MEALAETVREKISPFFSTMKESLFWQFDAAEWIIAGTKAYEYAETNLSKEEKEQLKIMVYASMLLEA